MHIHRIFVNYVQGITVDAIDKTIDEHFVKKFENFVSNHIDILELYQENDKTSHVQFLGLRGK